MLENQLNYFFDMDGVLAKYIKPDYRGDNPLFMKKNYHYFRKLEPDSKMINVLNAINSHCNKEQKGKVFIITSVTNIGDLFLEHTMDKISWLHEHTPFIDTKTQFVAAISAKQEIAKSICRPGQNLSYNDILIDDFNHNLDNWQNVGGQAVKYLNGINSPNAENSEITFSGLNLTENMSSRDIITALKLLNQSY